MGEKRKRGIERGDRNKLKNINQNNKSRKKQRERKEK